MKLFTAALALATVLLCANDARAEQGKLRMHVINVGQAESILIEMPNHALLIDAGGEETERDDEPGSFYRRELTAYLDKFFADNPGLQRKLYALILSHPHKDHTRYLEHILENYTVEHFIEGGHPGVLDDVRDARRIVSQRGIGHIRVRHTTVGSQELLTWARDIELRSGARVRFLSGRRGCNDENNDSLVMRIEFGQKSLLLTGDSEVDDRSGSSQGCGGQLPFLLTRFANDLAVLDADVYKVGHHGAINGSSEPFLVAVRPEMAVISAGHHSDRSPGGFHGFQHRHPNERTVQLLEDHVTDRRPQPVNVYTMTSRIRNGRTESVVIRDRRVEKRIYCTCWNTKAVVVTLSSDNTPIDVAETPQTTPFAGQPPGGARRRGARRRSRSRRRAPRVITATPRGEAELAIRAGLGSASLHQ